MNPRIWAALIVAAVSVYLVLIASRARDFVQTGDPVAVGLGVALAALPLIGAWAVWREVRFGFAVQRLARRLEQDGDLPVDDMQRTPSGRIDRAAADERFSEVKARVEAEPDSAAAWFALAVAYDDSRDRRRARAAMRTALEKAG